MATRARGGVSGLVYGLVFFVFLFVICLALAILFYTNYVQTSEELSSRTAEMRRLISAAEQGSDPYEAVQARTEPGQTIFGRLIDEHQWMKQKLGGAAMPYQQLQQRLQQAGVGEDQTVLLVLDSLRNEVAGLEQRVDTLAESDEQRRQTLAQLQERYEQLRQQHDQEMQSRSQEVGQLRQLTDQYGDQAQEQIQTLRTQWESDRERYEEQLRQRETDLRQGGQELAQLRTRIRELEGKLGQSTPTGPDMTLEEDGQIISVEAQGNLVYIDLGQQDRIVLGMPFEVFDPTTGIVLDETAEQGPPRLRGKATIEVIRLLDNSAACRVVREAYPRAVQVGDVIANLAYDRQRQYQFFVYGDFDLNYDGMTEPSDLDQVEAMINRWGGKVVDGERLPLDTDFLVLGVEPDDPGELRQAAGPEEIRRYEALVRKRNRYNELVEQAQALSIPVLNQNRFLTLMGYTQR
jgi:hypothetical protein